MEFNRNLLSCERKTKTFRCNFERTLAIVQFNKILIMTAGEFRVFDVSLSHKCYSFIDSGGSQKVNQEHGCIPHLKDRC